MKIKNEHERDDASTHMGVSKSQSRKTSETDIQTTKKKSKKPSEKINEETSENDSKYQDILIKMAEEINMRKEKILDCLKVKNNALDFENGPIITSGINKTLRYDNYHIRRNNF